MIRRDYILRMIEECIQALAQIRILRQSQRLEAAQQALDMQCEKLAGGASQILVQLSEMELLAHLAQGQPTAVVRDRLFLLVSFLREAGEIANAEGRNSDARAIFLKALHLLLSEPAQNDAGDYPNFAPRVDGLVDALAGEPLPIATLAMLMQHYERTGQWAKAEDALYAMLDVTQNDRTVADFGEAFYGRILRQNDAALAAGNLPRREAEEGLREIKSRVS
jgi:Family of unknown function (DUF6483)